MKLGKIIEGLEVLELHADLDTEISDVCFDSRKVTDGCLFIAMKGEAADGHDFIQMAEEKGAAACVCQRRPDSDTAYILVTDARKAVYAIGQSFFDSADKKLKIVGITGTNGKTTTSVLLKQVIEQTLGARVGLIGTNGVVIAQKEYASERTTPEYLDLMRLFARMAEAGCTHCVMEVSSHSLALGRVKGIHFEVAVFTNLTQDHLDFHGTMEEYSRAKALIFAQSGKAVVNTDNDELFDMHTKTLEIDTITCSASSNDATIIAKDIRLEPDCVRFAVVTLGEIVRTRLNIPGRFSVSNGLCVIGAAMQLGIGMQEAAEALIVATGVRGRLETLDTPDDFTIIIDYAHTPDALQKVLESLKETCRGRLVCVFGCGGDRDKTKRPIMGKIGTSLADFSIITSDNPRTEDPQAIVDEVAAGADGKKSGFIKIIDREKAIEYAIVNHKPGDTILLAGKGHETYQEVNGQKRHMDEREIVAEILERGKST